MCLYIFDTCHPFIKVFCIIFSEVKWLGLHGMYFRCQIKINDDMEFQYYKKIKIKIVDKTIFSN